MPDLRVFATRVCGWSILALVLVELGFLPLTGHFFDSSVFLTLADYVFFAHTPLTGNWSFGSISLVAVLLSQVPILIDPVLATAYGTRLFLLKLPSWLADLGTAAIVRRFSSDPAHGNYWALRYLLDPIVIFTTVLHGQWDALPNLASVAGIALMASERYEWAGLAFGLGVGAKFYPAAFVPLLCASALRGASLRTAARSLFIFALTAVATLLPVFWGRLDYIVHSYAFNSFGPGSGIFTTSLWSLLPPGAGFSTKIEQLVAVAIPIALAAAALRRKPEPAGVARAAMLTAMSIVLLNPGTHPPFYLWIAGPLVLYAAIANDGLISLAGLVLSIAAVSTQFCLEGSDEYFLLSIGSAPPASALSCPGSLTVVNAAVFVTALVIVAASFRPRTQMARATLLFSQAFAMACAVIFFAEIGTAAAAAARRPNPVPPARRLGALGRTLPLAPHVRMLAGGACRVDFKSYGAASFANNPFAQRFVTASLGYTLFSPQTMDIRGRVVRVQKLPVRYELLDLVAYDEGPVRVTQEFDVTRLLRPAAVDETMTQRPCGLIPKNPLLIYRFDLDAARAAAQQEPLLRRLNVFSREVR